MQPHSVAPARICLAMGAIGSIVAVVAVDAYGGDDRCGQVAVGEILLGDHFPGQSVGAHGVFGVERNEPKVVAAEAGMSSAALVDGAMGRAPTR